MKPKILILQGLSGSGKSSWAKQFIKDEVKQQRFWKRVNKDDLRAMIDDGEHSKGREAFILQARNALIETAISAGFRVIVDDTNLNPIHEEQIRQIFGDRAEVSIKSFMDVPLEECLRRDAQRQAYVGEKVIRRQWRDYQRWHGLEAPSVEHNPNLSDAIICDLDGTLALLNGRNPYDASTCENDLLNESVAEVIRRCADDCENPGQGYKVIFTSGRKDDCREQTERWLRKHDLWSFEQVLLMRRADDNRHDHEVKREMYEQHIRGKYNVVFTLDDRDQVVSLWRSLGLPCFQVAYGDF